MLEHVALPLLGIVSRLLRLLGAGLVTGTIDRREEASSNRVSCRGDGILPLRRRFGSEGPQRGPGDEVALEIECVVDGGMDTEEVLHRSR